jgi:oxygen-independent coproporphyrinogen III oxidase
MNLGLYLHIPYCLHKCGYCDFNSHPENQEESVCYVEALLSELKFYSTTLKNYSVPTVFMGGGTPTILPPMQLKKILQTVGQNFNLTPDCEITIEANPATIKIETLKEIRSAGYNRISIGVQSFDEKELELLERVHNEEEIHSTVQRARAANFNNLSIDLMFALPDQTIEKWQSHLKQAIAKNPDHISTYNLTIEPATAFFKLHEKGKLCLPHEDIQLEMYKITIQALEDAGYTQYEISNFSKPGMESQHNINYWNNGEYLGVGAGASSYLNGERFKNVNLPSIYIREIETKANAIDTRECLEPLQAMGETLMLGLRLLKGISIDVFENRFQVSFQKVYGKAVESLLNQELITLNQNRIALSRKGLFLADSVILKFMA